MLLRLFLGAPQSRNKAFPLLLASERGSLEMAELLLDAHADVDKGDGNLGPDQWDLFVDFPP